MRGSYDARMHRARTGGSKGGERAGILLRSLLFLVGLALIPLGVAATQTLLALVVTVRTDSTSLIPPSTLAIGGGYALWLLVYFTMPRPVRAYVLAHELTHALWGAAMGARIMNMSVARHAGSVTLSKNNVWITLAPYFFPLYTVIVVVAFYVLGLFYEVARYQLLWLGLVGFSWGFHLTFTLSSLMQHQSDLVIYGRLFSYALIYLMNVLGICAWVVMVSSPTWGDAMKLGGFYLREVHAWVWEAGRALVALVMQ